MNTQKTQMGFSLVELLVAALIFTFIVIGVSQLFASALDLQRRASGIQRIQENALFVLESISRAVRVSAITDGADCASGIGDADTLVIDHPVYGEVTYTYRKTEGRGELTRFAEDIGELEVITTEDVDVTRFAFCVSGNEAGDNEQARITIPMTLKAVSPSLNARVEVSMQTTVVSRDLIEELTN